MFSFAFDIAAITPSMTRFRFRTPSNSFFNASSLCACSASSFCETARSSIRNTSSTGRDIMIPNEIDELDVLDSFLLLSIVRRVLTRVWVSSLISNFADIM